MSNYEIYRGSGGEFGIDYVLPRLVNTREGESTKEMKNIEKSYYSGGEKTKVFLVLAAAREDQQELTPSEVKEYVFGDKYNKDEEKRVKDNINYLIDLSLLKEDFKTLYEDVKGSVVSINDSPALFFLYYYIENYGKTLESIIKEKYKNLELDI